MKRSAALPLLVTAGVVLASMVSCGTSVSGVETTNGFTVSATADDVSGTAPPNSQIYLCDTGYIPCVDRGTGIQTSADLAGRFDFSISTGDYSVMVITPDGKTAGVHFKNASGTAGNRFEESRTPQQPGSITGSIAGTFPGDTLLIYLVGMCHYRLVTRQNAAFTVSRVPAGEYRLRIMVLPDRDTTEAVPLYESDVTVAPSKTTVLDPISLQE